MKKAFIQILLIILIVVFIILQIYSLIITDSPDILENTITGLFIFLFICIIVYLLISYDDSIDITNNRNRTNNKLELSLKAVDLSAWRYDIFKKVFEKVYGYSMFTDKMTFDDFTKIVHPQDIGIFNNMVDNMQQGLVRTSSVTIRCKDNEVESGYGFYKFDTIVEEDPGVPIRHIIGMQKNVTFDKLSNMEFQNVLLSLDMAMRSANMTIWYFDLASDYIYILSHNEFVKTRTMHEFMAQAIYPEERTDCIHLYQDILDGRTNDFHGNIRIMGINDTEYRFYECNIVAIKDINNNVRKIVGTSRDITDKHAEHVAIAESYRRFSLAVKTSNIVLWEFDCITQLFTSFNEPLNNYDEKAKMSLVDYIHSIHPDDIDKIVPIDEILSLRQNKEFSIDLRFKYKNTDEWQYCTIIGAPLEIDDDGKVLKFTGTRKNNTLFIKLNEELKDAKEKAERSDRLKSMFLANMTHEIRTPLNAIVGYSQLIQDIDDKEEKAKLCDIINQNNDLLLNIINDILDLSRIEAGYIEFNRSKFDLSARFESFEEMFNIKMPEGVEFKIDNPYKECVVNIDWNRLIQLYTNFVSNACKYTVKGSITIGYMEQDEGMQIYCRDTGKGIAEEDQKRIFEHFEKVNNYVQGAGLGLSICRAIVESTGGKIGVNSQLGIGSLFWAYIPCLIYSKTKKE